MTSKRPPRAATWFLLLFGCSPDNEAILGDLAEQYGRGRSRFWYSSQVLLAVVTGFYNEVVQNIFLAVRCIIAGVVLAFMLSALLERLVLLHSSVISYGFPVLFWILAPALCVCSVRLTKFLAGRHRHYQRAFVLLYVVSFSSVLYVGWLTTLSRSNDARTSLQIVVGGIANYVWTLSAMAASGFFTQNLQVAAAQLSFEAASVRPSARAANNQRPGGDCRGTDSPGGGTIGLGRCVFQQMTLKELVSAAFSPISSGGRLGFPMNRIEFEDSGELGWINSQRFDINAKAEAASTTTEEELYQMFRQLLADRFRLTLRRTSKGVSGYALVVAKSGPKLKRATGNEKGAGMIAPGASPSGGFIGGVALPVDSITTFLQARLGRPVRDATGLSGLYNWELTWAPDDNEVRLDGLPVPARAADDFRPSLTTAVQEQLGLQLESGQVTVEVLVIEHAEKPIPN